MKALKRRVLWIAFIGLLGVVLMVVSLLQGNNIDNSQTVGFASGLIAISILKLIQFYRISKKPSLRKKYEIQQKEERLIAIAHRSGYMALMLSIIVEGIVIFISMILGKSTLIPILTTVAALQTFAYLITYLYYCKKY